MFWGKPLMTLAPELLQCLPTLRTLTQRPGAAAVAVAVPVPIVVAEMVAVAVAQPPII